MKILVTGCTGFIGSHLVDALKARGDDIFCTSKGSACPQENHISLDLSRKLDQERLPDDLDCLIHLVATMDKEIDEDEMFGINTLATLNLLGYGKKIKIDKFIFASTGGVYGYSQEELREDSSINPIDFYGVSKYLSESLARYFTRYFRVVVLRYFFPYGKDQEKGIIPMLTKKIRNKEPIFLEGRSGLRINPIHISDAVELTLRAIDIEGELETINIAGPTSLGIKDLADMIGEGLGIEPVYEYRSQESFLDMIGNISKMHKILGYWPKVSINREILKEII